MNTKEANGNTMLEHLIRKTYGRAAVFMSSLALGLYGCGDTTINNYYGKDALENSGILSPEVTEKQIDSSIANDSSQSKHSCIGDLEDSILEGETKSYHFENKTYEITLDYVDYEQSRFIINSKSTGSLKLGESYTLQDGATVCVNEILYQPYAGGMHASIFTFSAGKDAGKKITLTTASSSQDTASPDSTTITSPATLKINDKYTCGDFSWYPTKFLKEGVFNGYFVVGEKASAMDNLAMTDIATSMMYVNEKGQLAPVTVVDAAKLDSEIADISAQNVIVMGTPCVNSVTAELLGNPIYCDEGFTAGKAKIIILKHKETSNLAMIVAGYSGSETRLAAKVVAHRWQEIQKIQSNSCEILVEGTTWSDATLSTKKP